MAFGRAGVLGYLVLASVAVNLFLGGILAAHVLGRPFHPPPPPDPAHFVDRLAHSLPSQDGETLRHAFEAHETDIAQAVVEARMARQRAALQLEAEKLDLNALQAALDDVNAKNTALETLLQKTMVDALKNMSRDGRVRLAEMMPMGGPPPPPPH